MKKLLAVLAIFATMIMAGCGSFENSLGKMRANVTSGNYKVTLFSGGTAVKTWDVNGYINSEEGTDGWFWNDNGKITRVSGTVLIEEK